MVYIARVLISGRQKVALALLLVAFCAFLAYYPRVTEAILAFCLGGEVPGTNIVLSPDMVLALVAGVLGLGFLTLILRMYLRAARSKRNFKAIPVKEVMTVSIPVVEAVLPVKTLPEVKAPKPALRRRHTFAMLAAVLSRSITHVAQVLGHAIKAVATGIWKVISKCVVLALKALRLTIEVIFTLIVLVWFGFVDIARALKRGSIVAAKSTARASRRLWQWARPHMHRFDAWLEIQVRKLESRVKNKMSQHKTVRDITAIGREYRKSVGVVSPKTALLAVRHKTGHIKTKIVTTPQR